MKYIKIVLFEVLFLLIVSGPITGQDQPIYSADSLYNLGNKAYAEDQLDLAIFYYEKAKLLDPFARDIAVNLQLANEQLSTDIIELEPFFLATWWERISGLMLPGGWKVLSILLLVSILVLTFFYFFKGKPAQVNHYYSIVGVLIFLFIFSILAGQSRSNRIFNSPHAIIFGNDQSLYLGPDTVSEKVKQVTGGNKLKILDADGEWFKVAAMDSEQGWIKKDAVRRVAF